MQLIAQKKEKKITLTTQKFRNLTKTREPNFMHLVHYRNDSCIKYSRAINEAVKGTKSAQHPLKQSHEGSNAVLLTYSLFVRTFFVLLGS